MKIFLNGNKAIEVKAGSFMRPLVGINISTEAKKLEVSGVYHNRFKAYNDGSVITIVFGWNVPKYALFIHKFFPFITFYKANDENLLKEEE